MTVEAYDSGNVFAKILRGELPAHKLYEDSETLAFMDIMPRGDGHCLVIPKNPARNILDVAPDDLAAVIFRDLDLRVRVDLAVLDRRNIGRHANDAV